MLRPSWVEIDLAALKRNSGKMRDFIDKKRQFFAVVKSDGFGCGVARAAIAVIAGGADAVAVGSPADALAIRNAGIHAPILLYASTLPKLAAEVAALDVIVTLHDMQSLNAFASLNQPVEAYMKVEVGLGRLGVLPDQWEAAFETVKRSDSLKMTGIYTHLGSPGNQERIDVQMAVFNRACEMAEAMGLRNLIRMTAGSHAVLAHPETHCDAVNPGRCLFGLLEDDWAKIVPMQPVIASIKSHVIQVKKFSAGEVVGYLGAERLSENKRLAVMPIGFGDGFNHLPPLGEVLVAGKRAPLETRRGIEHMVIDVTNIADVNVGDEVVLLGKQGSDQITPSELSEWLDLPMLELLPRLARTIPHVYLD